jgi:hypothetical protein
MIISLDISPRQALRTIREQVILNITKQRKARSKSVSLAALFLAPLIGIAATCYAERRLEIGHTQTVLIIKDRKNSSNVDLRWRYQGERIESAKLLRSSSKNGSLYLLIDVQGFSKLRPDDRMCGAGTEDALVWLELGPSLEHLNSVIVPYNSCWWSIDGKLTENHSIDAEYSGGPHIPGHYITEDRSLNPDMPPMPHRIDKP